MLPWLQMRVVVLIVCSDSSNQNVRFVNGWGLFRSQQRPYWVNPNACPFRADPLKVSWRLRLRRYVVSVVAPASCFCVAAVHASMELLGANHVVCCALTCQVYGFTEHDGHSENKAPSEEGKDDRPL